MSKGKKLSGYAENIIRKAMGDDVPTKIDKSINTLKDGINTMISKYKALDLPLPKNVRNKIQQKRNRVKELKKTREAKYYKDAKKENLQTAANNPGLKAKMDEMNKETDKLKKLVKEGVITKGEAKEKAKALRNNSGGRIGSTKKPIKTKKLKVDQKNIIKKEPKDKLGNLGQNNVTTRKKGGKLRGMGKALRGGGKVMRG